MYKNRAAHKLLWYNWNKTMLLSHLLCVRPYYTTLPVMFFSLLTNAVRVKNLHPLRAS